MPIVTFISFVTLQPIEHVMNEIRFLPRTVVWNRFEMQAEECVKTLQLLGKHGECKIAYLIVC